MLENLPFSSIFKQTKFTVDDRLKMEPSGYDEFVEHEYEGPWFPPLSFNCSSICLANGTNNWGVYNGTWPNGSFTSFNGCFDPRGKFGYYPYSIKHLDGVSIVLSSQYLPQTVEVRKTAPRYPFKAAFSDFYTQAMFGLALIAILFPTRPKRLPRTINRRVRAFTNKLCRCGCVTATAGGTNTDDPLSTAADTGRASFVELNSAHTTTHNLVNPTEEDALGKESS